MYDQCSVTGAPCHKGSKDPCNATRSQCAQIKVNDGLMGTLHGVFGSKFRCFARVNGRRYGICELPNYFGHLLSRQKNSTELMWSQMS